MTLRKKNERGLHPTIIQGLNWVYHVLLYRVDRFNFLCFVDGTHDVSKRELQVSKKQGFFDYFITSDFNL